MRNRTQKTYYNGCTSPSIANYIAVPQGSILVPLLFILYINDIATSLKQCKIQLFADDALLYITSNSINEAVTLMNTDLATLKCWLIKNVLKLNSSKTKAMIIGKNSFHKRFTDEKLKIKIENEVIDVVENFKYLGVIIDNKLILNMHVSEVIKKIAAQTGYFSRVSKHLDEKTKILLYNSLILPHYQYCSSFLYFTTSENLNKLQLQNRGMRTILTANRYTPLNNMLIILKWLNVRQLLEFIVMVYILYQEKYTRRLL